MDQRAKDLRTASQSEDAQGLPKHARNAEVVALRRTGKTQAEIAERLGISQPYVSAILRRIAPELAPGTNVPSDLCIKLAERFFATDRSLSEIAAEFGVTKGQVAGAVYRAQCRSRIAA